MFLILQVVALLTLWIVLSGKFDALHLGFGLVSVILVVAMNWQGGVSQGDREHLKKIRWSQALYYPAWLFYQIIKANLQVAAIILNPRLPIEPALLRFSSPLKSRLAQVTLGSSITLTPGTVTLDMKGEEFLVHTLSTPLAESLIVGSVQRRVAAVFGDALEKPEILPTQSASERSI